ncbi:MAG: hypothetical protein WBB45_11515 [Cyclobacteriaceae bacterium]
MELEELRSHYNAAAPAPVSKETLLGMLSVNRHPVLKRIRTQLIMETTAWVLFLACYYNFFDGHLKPVFWHVALVGSVVLMLVHNLLGYRVTNNPISDSNVAESLRHYLLRIRKYAYVSVSSRAVALLMLFGFFLSGVDTFGQRHYISLGVAAVVLMIQVVVLWKIWAGRIQTITEKYKQFAE